MLKSIESSFIIKNDRNIIFVTFMLIFLIFLVSFIKEIDYRKDVLDRYISQKEETIYSIYASKINLLRNTYTNHLTAIKNDNLFKASILANDTNTTNSILNAQFDIMQQENSYIRKLKLVNTDNMSDVVGMFDAGEWGLYYRVSVPITYQNKTFGALQMDIDFRLFLEKFNDIVEDVEWILLIENNKIKQQNNLKEWYNYTVLQASTNIDISTITTSTKEISKGDKYYFVDTNFVINSINKIEVAKLIILIDITKQKQDYYNTIYTQTILFIIFSFVILSILFYSFRLYKIELEKKSEETRKKDEFIKEQLQDEVNKKVQELKQQEVLLLEQSKLAIMGEMISMIAHQWRQPLSHITLNLESIRTAYILEGKVTYEHIDKHMEKIVEKVLFMSNTIEEFRSFFRPNEPLKLVALKEVVAKALSFFEYSIEKNSIQINLDCTCDKSVQIYVSKFIQVVMNIIKNAEEELLNKQDDRQIYISGSNDNDTVTLLIKDNGGGIKAENISKIFEPYYSTKSKNSSGVGLYMCKMIVEKHLNGTITAYNEDKCAVFKITLPVYKR